MAASLNNLAELYRAQGKEAEAEALRVEALAIWVKALGPEHPKVAIALNNLAQSYGLTGLGERRGSFLCRSDCSQGREIFPALAGSHRLHNLAVSGEQQSRAVSLQRRDAVGVPCGLRQAVQVGRKAFLLWAWRARTSHEIMIQQICFL